MTLKSPIPVYTETPLFAPRPSSITYLLFIQRLAKLS